MKKVTRIWMVLIVTALVLGMFLQAGFAQEQSRRGDRRRRFDPDRMFDRMDENDDGKISREEFRGPDDRFDEMDEDKDGFLVKDDFPGGDESGRDRSGMMERMMERFLDHIKEELGSTDEEWTYVKPLISNVMRLRMEAQMGAFMPGQWGGPSEDDVENPAGYLRKTLDSEDASVEDVKEKLEAFREEKKKKEEKLKNAREELRKVLTVKQEAHLVLMGILD